LADYSAVAEPVEDGATFEANARLKAGYYARALRDVLPAEVLVIAEDSGLEIDALGGEPGVHSARFLGPRATYAERFVAIAARLRGVVGEARSARFVCAVAVVRRDGALVFETRATIEGRIADAPAGDAGFGYDPIFVYPPYGRTLAQATPEEKGAVAHRGQAFRALAEWLAPRDGASDPLD
jgi:XTP/dITP diphosphohydrolase